MSIRSRIIQRFNLTDDIYYRSFVENIGEYAVLMLDSKGCILTWNKGARDIFKYSESEVKGRNFSFLFTKEDQRVGIPRKELETANVLGRAEDDRKHIRKDGAEFWASGVTVLLKHNGEQIGFAMVLQDISDQKSAEETIRHQVMHDSLTGLPNRKLMHDRLEQAIHQCRQSHEMFVVAFVDLDKFKEVNDTDGHGMGDLLLQEVAVRLAGCVRQDDTVARLGGDEFIVILRKLKSIKQAERAILKIWDVFQPSFYLNNKLLGTKASIGVAVYPNDGNTTSKLMKRADNALYRAKHAGGNCYAFFKERRLDTSPVI